MTWDPPGDVIHSSLSLPRPAVVVFDVNERLSDMARWQPASRTSARQH